MKKLIKENLCFIISMIFCIIFLLNFRFIRISGNSMDSTLANNEIHFSQLHKEINKGDIVVANSDLLDMIIVKRVIGIPGDTIQIKDNVMYVNDEEIEEDYIMEEMITEDIEPYTLKENEYFLCGDNRNHSTDSRVIGPVLKEDIIGVMLF